MIDDLSQMLLTQEYRFCPQCTPTNDTPHITICAVCLAHYCSCINCQQWLHDYAYSFTVLCICEKGAMERIDTNNAHKNESIMTRSA